MRKALLVVVLVAASFAGGAVVNGPGLSWAKGLIGGRMRESDAIPTLNLEGDGPKKPPAEPHATPSTAFPAAPAPPLGGDLAALAANPPPLPPPKPSAPAELPSEARPPSGSPALEAPSLDNPPELPPPAPSPPGPIARREPVRQDSALTPAATPATSSPDWASIRARMKGLGVSRYWIESTPSGPSKVRCSIPVAGSGSVFQQFEAEGDDDLRAAEAVLRRITLWKATEKE